MSPQRGVLHLVICAGGSAPEAHRLAGAARAAGWDVYAIPTPNAMEFVDVEQLAAATGHAVRARWRRPGEPGSLPAADAVVVAPATYNSINKWAAGIADVYALGQLAEAVGRRLPIVVLPFVNGALAANPAYERSLQTLRGDGVRLLDGSPDADGVRRGLPPHPPGTGGQLQGHFPWAHALDALDAAVEEDGA